MASSSSLAAVEIFWRWPYSLSDGGVVVSYTFCRDFRLPFIFLSFPFLFFFVCFVVWFCQFCRSFNSLRWGEQHTKYTRCGRSVMGNVSNACSDIKRCENTSVRFVFVCKSIYFDFRLVKCDACDAVRYNNNTAIPECPVQWILILDAYSFYYLNFRAQCACNIGFWFFTSYFYRCPSTLWVSLSICNAHISSRYTPHTHARATNCGT